MARETTQNRDEKIRQRDSGTSPPRESQRAQGDSERAIETRRDSPAGIGVTRRPGYGGYGGGLAPMSVMNRLADDMDRLFESFGFGRTGWGLTPAFGTFTDRGFPLSPGSGEASWAPQVETFRRGDKFVVRADLPGMRKEDVSIELDDNRLTISGDRSHEFEEDRDDFYRSERSYGRFFRAIPLPEGVNADQCAASFDNGVLEITVPAPKEKEPKSRRVQIR